MSLRSITSLLVVAATLLLARSARAHDPHLGTFILSEQAGHWRLEAHLSTDGMHQFLTSKYPHESLSEVSPKVYQDYVESELRSGIELRYDGTPVVLGKILVNLAAHATQVSIAIEGPSPGAREVEAHIEAFDLGGMQNNIFQLAAYGFRRHVVLKSKNQFRGSLSLLAGDTAVAQTQASKTSSDGAASIQGVPRWTWTVGFGLAALVLLAWRYGKRRRWLVVADHH